jgi:hypothetical protein
MKATPQAAIMFFLGAWSIPTRIVVNASVISNENNEADVPNPSQMHRSLQGKRSTSNPKKGNNGKGGKKGGNKDCNKTATPLNTNSCPIQIMTSGRYVLPNDVQCGTGVNGIEITAKDVYLDCQDHTITGDGVTTDVDLTGISLSILEGSSSDVTITELSCHKVHIWNSWSPCHRKRNHQ